MNLNLLVGCLSVCLSPCLRVYLSVYLPAYMSISMSTCLSACIRVICLSISLLTCLSVCQSVCPPACLYPCYLLAYCICTSLIDKSYSQVNFCSLPFGIYQTSLPPTPSYPYRQPMWQRHSRGREGTRLQHLHLPSWCGYLQYSGEVSL